MIQIQPAEGIQLHFHTKVPGGGMRLRYTDLEFSYSREFAGRLPEASAHLSEALRLDPKDVLALTLLGKIRLQQGDRAAARELFRRALALDPRNPDAQQGMSALSR